MNGDKGLALRRGPLFLWMTDEVRGIRGRNFAHKNLGMILLRVGNKIGANSLSLLEQDDKRPAEY